MTVTSIVAFESVSCLAMSLAVNSALMGVAVAPERRMPWKATAKPELLGDSRPTTSPTPIPRPASAPANASMRATVSRYVASRPDFASTSAIRSRSTSSMRPNRKS